MVERSFAWLDKSRRLYKNCERRPGTSLQLVHLAWLAAGSALRVDARKHQKQEQI